MNTNIVNVLLSPEEVRALAEHHPELKAATTPESAWQAVTIAGSATLLSAVRVFVEQLAHGQPDAPREFPTVVSDQTSLLTPDRVEQITRQAEAWRAFVASVDMLTSAMIGARSGRPVEQAQAEVERPASYVRDNFVYRRTPSATATRPGGRRGGWTPLPISAAMVRRACSRYFTGSGRTIGVTTARARPYRRLVREPPRRYASVQGW